MDKRILKLQDFASIRVGLHAQSSDAGDISYLQAGQFDGIGRLVKPTSLFLEYQSKVNDHLLQDGDVLLAAKGYRNFAWCYRKSHGPAIASSTFFVIHTDSLIVYPEFLTTFFNLQQTQAYFQQLGGGTNIVSLRKSELGAFEIPIPPLDQQYTIANFNWLHQREIKIHEDLIIKKQQLHTSFITQILK